jgi:hypothetical protein
LVFYSSVFVNWFILFRSLDITGWVYHIARAKTALKTAGHFQTAAEYQGDSS